VASDVCPRFFDQGTDDSLRRVMARAGYGEILIERLRSKLPFPNDSSALGAAFEAGPVAMAYGRFSQRTKQQVHLEYLRSIERYRNGAGYEIPGEFVLAKGWKEKVG